eukprot:1725100-Alexandrium_andersonii.AAC.1
MARQSESADPSRRGRKLRLGRRRGRSCARNGGLPSKPCPSRFSWHGRSCLSFGDLLCMLDAAARPLSFPPAMAWAVLLAAKRRLPSAACYCCRCPAACHRGDS